MKRLFFSVLLAGLGHWALAQGPSTGGPTPQAPAAVPLDGGASLLLAGGAAYGLRRLRRPRHRPLAAASRSLSTKTT